MRRIAIVAHGLSNGGAERVAVNLANYFANNYAVLYIAAYDDTPEYTVDEKVVIKGIHTKKTKGISRLVDRNRKILEEIQSFNADSVISFITKELLFTQLAGYPMIYSLRIDPARADKTLIDKWVRRYEYSHSKNVVFQTKDAREYYGEKIKNKGVVICNPMKSDDFPFWLEQSHKKTFITACRLEKQKNIPMLIDAFIKFHNEYPDYNLEIYGKGNAENEIMQKIVKLGCERFVTLKGHSKSIHEIMARSYAFVLSSDFEGLSNSMLEALAVGVPCICTDCPPGGAREYIEDGVNGLLTPVGDVDEMYRRMVMLVDGSLNLELLSKNAIKIREEVRLENTCKKWEELL